MKVAFIAVIIKISVKSSSKLQLSQEELYDNLFGVKLQEAMKCFSRKWDVSVSWASLIIRL